MSFKKMKDMKADRVSVVFADRVFFLGDTLSTERDTLSVFLRRHTLSTSRTTPCPLLCISRHRKNRRRRYETKTTCDMMYHRVSGAHEDGMTYTDSLTYVDSPSSVSGTISDAPDVRPDAPDTTDAGETTDDDGCESPIMGGGLCTRPVLCVRAVRCASPILCEPAPPPRMVDEDGDVFDLQGRQFHGPALKTNNIMRLLDYVWFRTEW
jgi:hypothetical protein